MENSFNLLIKKTTEEKEAASTIFSMFEQHPLPKEEILKNLGLFVDRQTLSRFLFMNEMYQRIISINGSVIEFGTRWGQNLALFENLRGIYEPFNYTRKIIAFDTFEGFPSVHPKDGTDENVFKGAYAVSKNYEDYLYNLLSCHKKNNPISHINNIELVKGNAITTIKKYVENHPELMIAFAYFDFDIYEPTYECLMMIKDRLVKGAVIGFDELNHPNWPGETLAFKEVFGISNYKVYRSPFASYSSYIVFE